MQRPRWISALAPSNGAPRFVEYANAVGLLLLALTALSFGTYAYKGIAFPYQIYYAEGPILDQVMRLSRFESIYEIPTASGPYTVANYPPLYHLLQLPFAWVAGPAFWYGRAISVLAAFATAVFIAATVHTLTRDRVASLISGLVFLSIPYVIWLAPLTRIDMLALAFTWAALFVISRWPEARWSLVLTAALFVAAAFTRQTSMLAGPLAAFAMLVGLGHRRRAFLLAAVTAVPCLLISLAVNVATGGGLYYHVVIANVNPLYPRILWLMVSDLVEFMAILLGCAAAFVFLETSPKARWLLLPYLIGAVAVGLTVMKVGSDINYLLELAAAMSACLGALVATARTRTVTLRVVLAAAVVVQALLLGLWWHRIYYPRSVTRFNAVAIEKVRDMVEQADGPVILEEDMGVLPLLGRPIAFQPFEMTQLSDSGHWDQSAFVRSIQEKRYPVITKSQFPVKGRWTDEMHQAIVDNYVPTETIFGVDVYRPGPAPP